MQHSMNPVVKYTRVSLHVLRAAPRFFLMSQNAAIGGQAVMEGVMMRSPNHWAVAIRRANGDIAEVVREHKTYASKHRWARFPVIRGSIALGESMVIGMRALNVSTYYAIEDLELEAEEKEREKAAATTEADSDTVDEGDYGWGDKTAPYKVVSIEDRLATAPQEPVNALEQSDDLPSPVSIISDEEETEADPESMAAWQIALMMVVALGFSILLFKVTPLLITKTLVTSKKSMEFVLLEGGVRVGIFVAYLSVFGFIPGMKRVFQYHSAEHKSINAWESNVELTPELVNKQSRIHVRCGTAFLLWVMVVAIVVFGVFGKLVHPNFAELVASRVLLLPLIAGVSFELIKFAGKFPRNTLIRAILAPGLWMQYLTTRQCDAEQCEVAVRSLELVLEREYPERSLKQALAAASSEDDAVQVLA